MPSCGTACCQFPSTPCAWCSTFGSSPPPISQTENDPYVRIAHTLDAEGSLIRFFMRDEGPVDCSSKADLVDNFCAGASITPHESGADADANEDADARHVALVDDRSNDGNVAVSRKNPGALTAKVLLRYLSTMVRFKRGSKIRAGAAQSGRELPEREDSLVGQPNADRRLLFVTDLDCKAVLALVHTAPERQARALRDSIYNHLAFKASIVAAISRDALPAFRLAFDLPFYALRRSENAIEDLPRRGDGKVLRFCEDVSFLVAKLPKSSGASSAISSYYLCEAHVSCVVWGTNNSRWEADMFLDTFFGNGESIEEYEYDPDGPEQMEEDPLRAGKAGDKLILDPRLYFLDALAVRIKRVREEWRHVLDILSWEIKASIHAYQQNFPWSSAPEYPAVASEGSTTQIEQARNWTFKTVEVVTRLIQSLSSISNHRAEFDSQRAAYFGCMDSSAQQTLQTIQDTFLQLEALGKDFNHLRDCCERLRNDCLSDLQDKQTQRLIQMQCQVIEAQHEISKKQQETAGRSMAMETVMLIVALITSVIAMFSIPKGNNLFPTDPRLFILVVIIFGLVAYAMQVYLVDPSRCLKLLSRMLEKLWDVTANICTYLSGRFRDLRDAIRRTDSDQVPRQDLP